jgi:aromatic-L-amino-acid/L-tryptophan decarboxylase
MTPEEFRIAGHALIDWIADDRNQLKDRRVLPDVRPGDIRAMLPATPPTVRDASIEPLLAELDRVVVPGMTSVQHPRHFGWFPSNASLASVLGDIASSGLGGLGISWESNPALTEVEEVMCDWMRQLCGLSDAWSGTIQDTASTAGFVALLTARERSSNESFSRGGLAELQSALTVYTTTQAHSSVMKAALLAGFGADNVRMVAMDPNTYAMDPASLEHAISTDIAAGLTPCIVIASLGSTGVTAFDPLPAIADLCERHSLWLHADAAMSGAAMMLPECRGKFEGIERADSISWNPHKWMGTILDCSLYYVRDVDQLVRVMGTNPSYLRSTSTDREATQYRDWGIPLGRRFRALKLWFHLRLDGVEVIQARLRRDLANAEWFAEQVRAEPGWSVVAPVTLQTVCVRHTPTPVDGGMLDSEALDSEALDQHTLGWIRRINSSGQAFCSPSQLDGQWMVRVSIGVESTERSDLQFLWDLFRREASK